MAAIASGFLGDYKDAVGIIAIVVLIAVLGFSQEYQAQKAIGSLILDDGSLILDDECLILDDECLILDDECLILDDGSLILDDGSLILDDGSLILDDECLILADQAPSGRELLTGNRGGISLRFNELNAEGATKLPLFLRVPVSPFPCL